MKGEANVKIMKDIKNLASPDQLPQLIMKRKMFDDVQSNKPAFNEYTCRVRHKNLNIMYFIQFFCIDYILIRNLFLHINQFSLDGKKVREIWTLSLFLPPSLAGACFM